MISVLKDYPRITPPEDQDVMQVICVTLMFDRYVAVRNVSVDDELRGLAAFDACIVVLGDELRSDDRLSIKAKNHHGHEHEFVDAHSEGIDWLKRHIVGMQIVHYQRGDDWPNSLAKMSNIRRRTVEFL